jgi:hypothetical protein
MPYVSGRCGEPDEYFEALGIWRQLRFHLQRSFFTGFLTDHRGPAGICGNSSSHKLDYGTPISALTANAMEDDGSCLAAGMDDYVGKPRGIGSFGLIAGFGDARSLFLTLHAFVTRRPSMRLAPSSVR